MKLLAIRPIRIALLLMPIVCALEEGGNIPNLWNGMRAMMIVLALEESSLLQKRFGGRHLASTGKNVLGVFLIHMPILMICGGWLFRITSGMQYSCSFLISLAFSWCITIVLAYPISRMLNEILRLFTKLLNIAFSVFD